MLKPIRNSKSTLRLIAATGLLLGMSACMSSDQRTSNSASSDTDANLAMDSRLENSKHVKDIIAKVDIALRPVANILSDVEKFLKADEKEEVRKEISHIKKLSISMIREQLDQIKNQLVEKKMNGNWSVEQSVRWPFNRDGTQARSPIPCDKTYLDLEGELVSKSENVSLNLFDCALPQPTTLLWASVSEDLTMKAELNLGDLEQLLKPGVTKGPCSIESMAAGTTQMDCAPFTEAAGNLSFEFEKIAYTHSAAGDIMDFAMTISEVKDGALKPLARATVNKNIGEKTNVKVIRL
jgi:hypothetical protein